PCVVEKYIITAQLSPSTPFSNSSLSIVGVRPGGYFERYSSPWVWPQTFSSSTGIPATRTKTRTDMLFTLGGSMFSFMAMTCPPPVACWHKNIPRLRGGAPVRHRRRSTVHARLGRGRQRATALLAWRRGPVARELVVERRRTAARRGVRPASVVPGRSRLWALPSN